LEAFRGRGKGVFLFSHDLEDLMAVVDGRASLLEESRLSPPEFRNDLAAQFHELLNTSAFLEALPHHQGELPRPESKPSGRLNISAGSSRGRLLQFPLPISRKGEQLGIA
jgi:hypothetical protein